MTKYIRKNDIVTGKLSDEQVMLDIEKGKYFSLNPVATTIWDMLEESLSIDTLCEKLIATHYVELNTCKVDTKEYIKEMVALGLIKEIS